MLCYNGTAFAGVIPALNNLSNVSNNIPSSGQILQWNSGTGFWTPQNLPSFVTAYASLTDVALTGIANNQFPVYNNSTSKWNN